MAEGGNSQYQDTTRDIWGTFIFSLPFNRSFYSFWFLIYCLIKPARCVCLSFAERISKYMKPAQWVRGGSFSIDGNDSLNSERAWGGSWMWGVWGIISFLRILLLFSWWKPWPHLSSLGGQRSSVWPGLQESQRKQRPLTPHLWGPHVLTGKFHSVSTKL